MKFTLTIDPSVSEVSVAVTAAEIDDDVRAIEQIASGSTPSELRRIIGMQGRDAAVIDVRTVLAFYTKDKSVWAHTASGEWQLKQRLYEIEKALPAGDFARISQSEIVSINAIKNLDLSLTGTISVHLKDGTRYYVSRRQLSSFKAKLGL
ncbi:LytTR family DNA-binding domain-containing protein [Arcanobacterium hippocoleae]